MLRLTIFAVLVAMATAFPRGHVNILPSQAGEKSFDHQHFGRWCRQKHMDASQYDNTISTWFKGNGGFFDNDKAFGHINDRPISFGQFRESDVNENRFDGLGLTGLYGDYQRFS